MSKLNLMPFHKLFVFTLGTVALSMFLGCAKYKPNSFTKPTGESVEKDNVKVAAQKLSESDCKHYFSRQLLKKGYQPVQIYVKNEGDHSLVLDASTINMPIENRDHVASQAHIDAMPRVVGWGVGGLFVWPFFIPAVYEGLQVSNINRKLDHDFESRTLDMNSKLTIKPHSTVNTVFFVRKENVSNQLNFTLRDHHSTVETDFGLLI